MNPDEQAADLIAISQIEAAETKTSVASRMTCLASLPRRRLSVTAQINT